MKEGDGPFAPAVVAFGGAALSGKSLLSARVAEYYRWKRASFGEYVRDVAARRDLEPNRENLQAIGEELINGDLGGFCRAVLARAGWHTSLPLVIDGVRHTRVVDTLRLIVSPLPFFLIVATASRSVRMRRLEERKDSGAGRLESGSVQAMSAHSTEREALTLLPSVADLAVNTDSAEDDVIKEVISWLNNRLRQPR